MSGYAIVLIPPKKQWHHSAPITDSETSAGLLLPRSGHGGNCRSLRKHRQAGQNEARAANSAKPCSSLQTLGPIPALQAMVCNAHHVMQNPPKADICRRRPRLGHHRLDASRQGLGLLSAVRKPRCAAARSEERRVGKECSVTCRSRWSPYH